FYQDSEGEREDADEDAQVVEGYDTFSSETEGEDDEAGARQEGRAGDEENKKKTRIKRKARLDTRAKHTDEQMAELRKVTAACVKPIGRADVVSKIGKGFDYNSTTGRSGGTSMGDDRKALVSDSSGADGDGAGWRSTSS
ncbi:unnamed protein product, partial [Amoebophrya sp. A25]